MTEFEVIQIARKYNLEKVVRQEFKAGLTPEQVLEKWDML